MATTRATAGSVLDAVGSVSSAVSATFNTATDSIEMLHNFVRKHKTMQSLKTDVELDQYAVRLAEDTALENVKRRIEIKRFIDANPDYASEYQKELDKLKRLVKITSDDETSSN